MTRSRNVFVQPVIAEYCDSMLADPDIIQLEIEKVTAERTGVLSRMQIGFDQSLLMEMLARFSGATRAIEIGTFTGTSALAIARGMGPKGKLICCDVNVEWTAVAKDAWEKAGVADRIDLRIGPAAETLAALTDEPQFDMAFLDADKTGYLGYYRQLVGKMKPGGLIIADNTLQDGRVCDVSANDPDTLAIREFNLAAASDPRVRSVLLPLADGITIAQVLET